MSVEGQELDVSVEVLRVVRKTKIFIPEGAQFPTLEAFRPSQEDEAEAQKRQRPVRVSVWNSQLTSVSEAKLFRNTQDQLGVYGATVDAINAVARQLQEQRIRVVADPLTSSQPGAAGHCGIEGLDRPLGSAKVRQKEILHEISKAFAKHYE